MAPRPAALALAAALAVLLLASSAPVATAIRPEPETETAASKVVVAPDEVKKQTFHGCMMRACASADDPSLINPGALELFIQDGAAEKVDGVGCEDLGEEECMARRTLAAHTDYIYTQQHHN
ncbi:hypothetical protein ABZP36_002484 [Zizania latifolia]